MAYKVIHDYFWTDPYIKDLKPETKLLFFYLITNRYTHYSGIYHIHEEVIQLETGLSKKDIKYGIDTLSKGYRIVYDRPSGYIWVIQMAKYQANGIKQWKGIANHLKTVHNKGIIAKFLNHYKDNDIPYQYPIDTLSMGNHTETVTVTETETENSNRKCAEEENAQKEKIPYKEIMDYFNKQLNRKFTHNREATQDLIRARWNEGFRVDDFKRVVDNKVHWVDDEKMDKYLRPETLFSNKHFESYLNEKPQQEQRGFVQ